MANKYRNEFSFIVAGETYTVRPRLSVLVEMEDRFNNIDPTRRSVVYQLAGLIISKSDKAIDESDAADLVFDEGFAKADEIVALWNKHALQLSDKVGKSNGKKPAKAS